MTKYVATGARIVSHKPSVSVAQEPVTVCWHLLRLCEIMLLVNKRRITLREVCFYCTIEQSYKAGTAIWCNGKWPALPNCHD